jgi:hypothetical protein
MSGPFTADEYALVGFFGGLPRLREEEVPWQYNDACYAVSDDGHELTFAIAPSYRDVRVRMTAIGTDVCLFEFHAAPIQDIRVHRDKVRESLEVVIAPGNSLWLVLAPKISLLQEFDGHALR